MDTAVADIERALVKIRRRQTRRAIAGPVPTAAHEALDAVEAAESAGRATSVGDVAVALHVDQPRASRMVAAAVEAGLVRRLADPADGRRSLLATTAQGRRSIEAIRDRRREVFSAAMAEWEPGERDTFARLLVRFVDALEGDRRSPTAAGRARGRSSARPARRAVQA